MMRPLDYESTWGLSESRLTRKIRNLQEDSSMGEYSGFTLREKPELKDRGRGGNVSCYYLPFNCAHLYDILYYIK